jgi:hypothetical protein
LWCSGGNAQLSSGQRNLSGSWVQTRVMMKNSKRIGPIGLHIMEFPMTSQLAAAGYSFFKSLILGCDAH